MTLLRLIIAVFIIGFLFSKISYADDYNNYLKYFEKKCVNEPRNQILFLIDNTDPLQPEQQQFILDNFINEDSWSNEGDIVTIVAMGHHPVALMPYVSVCAPKPERLIDDIVDPIRKIKQENRGFLKFLEMAFINLSTAEDEAEKTLLVEAVTEVYRNNRYKFKKNPVNRTLILVSDLYQHSDLLSFFRMCSPKNTKKTIIEEETATARHSSKTQRTLIKKYGRLVCPSFEETRNKSDRFNNYLVKAKPVLNDGDKINVYYLNVDGRVDRSGENWWIDYFNHSANGKNINIEIIPELQY